MHRMTRQIQAIATKLRRSVVLFGHTEIDDDLLITLIQEDIRGRFTHTAAIDITAQNGVLTLNGPVLDSEHAALVAYLRQFRGVRSVNDDLRPQRQRGDLPDVSAGEDSDT